MHGQQNIKFREPLIVMLHISQMDTAYEWRIQAEEGTMYCLSVICKKFTVPDELNCSGYTSHLTPHY